MSLTAQLKVLRKSKLSEPNVHGDNLDFILSRVVGVSSLSNEDQDDLLLRLRDICEDTAVHWEVTSFCIRVLNKLCSLLRSSCMIDGVLPMVYLFLEHSESQVRLEACQLIPFIVNSHCDYDLSAQFTNYLLQRLVGNMDRTDSTRPALLGDAPEIALDDTTGWNNLVSYLQAVHVCIVSQVDSKNDSIRDFFICGSVIREESTIAVFELILSEFPYHLNRHIREMSLQFIGQYFNAWKSRGDSNDSLVSYTKLSTHGSYSGLFPLMTSAIAAGMKDNWSQIRLKAINACHSLLSCLVASSPDNSVMNSSVTRYVPDLLPGLCLNRYYTAEAVQNAALAAWRDVITVHGKTLISLYASDVVDYYIEESRSNNHMVAEAACMSLGEFIAKLDRDTVAPRVHQITEALSACLHDERWPVKDQACVPTGMLVRFYPEETREKWDDFVRLWNVHLKDCIWSVRENAALAYAAAVQCPEAEEFFLKHIQQYLRENLLSALKDTTSAVKPSMKNFSFLPPSMLVPKGSSSSASKALPMEDDKVASLVTEPVMMQLPKKSWGCCVDCVELRQSLPWEVTQGALYLLREISKIRPTVMSETFCYSQSNNTVSDSLVTYAECVSLLLATETINNADKLHNAVYEELPSVLAAVSKCGSIDFNSIAKSLSRDLTASESGGASIDAGANRNEAKYKVNRVAASAAAASGTGASGSTATSALFARRDTKSARRIMAEKCVERLLNQGSIRKSELLALLSSEAAKEVVQGIAAESVNTSRTKFEEYFG